MAKETKPKPVTLPSAEIWRDGIWHPAGAGPVADALKLVAADDKLNALTGFQMERLERIMRWCYDQGKREAQPAPEVADG